MKEQSNKYGIGIVLFFIIVCGAALYYQYEEMSIEANKEFKVEYEIELLNDSSLLIQRSDNTFSKVLPIDSSLRDYFDEANQ